MTNSKHCKICNGVRLVEIAHTARCRDCGVLLFFPYPPASHPGFVSREEKVDWYSAAASFNHMNFTRMLKFATTNETPRDELSILDFGGGGGQFALVSKSCFPFSRVYLVDINDASALEEWDGFSERIRFADFGSDATRFDLIFLNDVFEHLDDPVGRLSQLSGKLTARGKIFIDTPRQFWIYPVARLLSRNLYLKLLRGTVTNIHLQIWSDKAFEDVVRKCGLVALKRAKWAEFTMPADFYLRNMGVTNPILSAIGHFAYDASGWLLRNKIVCLLRPR